MNLLTSSVLHTDHCGRILFCFQTISRHRMKCAYIRPNMLDDRNVDLKYFAYFHQLYKHFETGDQFL